MQRNNETIIINNTNYLISETLGSGAFGEVLKGFNEEKQQIVAIKKQQQINDNEQNMLIKMKGNNYKNLINIHEFERVNNFFYIVMEYCEESLYDRLQKKGTIKPDDIRYIMKEIANGLKEIHDLNYAHRDLKPENVLIFQKKDINGNVQEIYKLCDFGTIKEIDVLKTQQVGTPYYQAPEQLNNSDQYTSKVDIWAFGALIYELMTNVPMFNGYNQNDIQSRIRQITQQDIDNIINTINLERKYKTLLLNMLQVNPNKRFDINQIISDMRGQSQNVTKNSYQKQPFLLQAQQQPPQDLPKSSNYNKNSQLPAPHQLKQEHQQQLQKLNQNNHIQFQNIQNSNQAKPLSNFQSERGRQIAINQTAIKMENRNYFQPQNSIPQQLHSNHVQVQPVINQQQSNNIKDNEDSQFINQHQSNNSKNKQLIPQQLTNNTRIPQPIQQNNLNQSTYHRNAQFPQSIGLSQSKNDRNCSVPCKPTTQQNNFLFNQELLQQNQFQENRLQIQKQVQPGRIINYGYNYAQILKNDCLQSKK